ncbi:MAG: DUF983 domain-containing protein [Acidimicrobiales bacterium]
MSPARMLSRGLRRRCAVCGSGRLFTGWWRMRDRCPGCGYVFAREDGFWVGAMLMNFAVTEALVAVLCIVPLIAVLAANPDANILPVVAGGLVAVLAGPLAFYPFSRTLWVALELMVRPAHSQEPDDRR